MPMPLGERLLRRMERRLLPWYDRKAETAKIVAADKALRDEDAKAKHTAEIERDSVAARKDAARIRKLYADRLDGTRR